jgi:2-amino-4-hydroxy-6-hydroxymethyldihydropteridine diphosphokinase
MSTPESIFLLLGANLGDRLATLEAARANIADRVGTVTNTSSIYETEPWGLQDQPAFLNQVLEISSGLAPEEILRNILAIEHELGRVRYERWGARAIDIDILYYGDRVLDTARLTIPHPRMAERRFTLVPLSEIAPYKVHPLIGRNSLELLQICPDDGAVSKFS